MTLLILLLLLVVPFLAGKVTLRHCDGPDSTQIPFRIGLSVFFTFTGIGHFLKTEEMSLMLGEAVPYPLLAVQVTGVLELLAAVGVWLPAWRRMTGYCLVTMMIAFLPFNICAAIDRVPFGGHESGPIYLLVRVPFQLLVIWWIGKASAIKPYEWLRGTRDQRRTVKV
jgi:uncharacterized membrane protein